MSLFNSTKSNQTETTNNNLTDNRVASTGGVAAGAGANVTVNDISGDVAKAAIDSNTQATRDATAAGSYLVNTALTANGNVALASIDAQNATVDKALNFAAVSDSGSRELALSAIKGAVGQSLPDSLPQTPVTTLVGSGSSALNNVNLPQVAKYGAIAAAAIAAVYIIGKLISKK